MADFAVAMKKLRDLEGGYVPNHAGETYIGISRSANPMWPGWVFVDRLKQDHANLVELNHEIAANPIVQSFVDNHYQQQYWKFDELPQTIAEKVFLIEISLGRTRGVGILQQALAEVGETIELDSSLGPQTILATVRVVQTSPEALLIALRAFAAQAHCEIVIRNPDQHVFLKGWLLRDAI